MISSKAQEYRDELVKKLCDAMENGTAPWQKTWTDGDAPFNAVSGRAYHGINAVNLALQSQALGSSSDPRWLTFDQAKEKGWHVKQGEKGTHVEFYKFEEKPKFDESGSPVFDADGKQKVEKNLIVKNYVVFHASQIEGIEPYVPKSRNPIEDNEKAERILKESGAKILHGGNEAFYNRSEDYIQVPNREQFKSQADYYASALHELGHWTGHPDRLNRKTSNDMKSETYAKEELVAEISSMFVSAETGIPQTQEHFENHASYVDYWVKAVKEDPNALFKAVSQAQKASEEILKYERVREREQKQAQNQTAEEFKSEITLLNSQKLLKKIVTEAEISEATSLSQKADEFYSAAISQGVFVTALKEPQKNTHDISQLRGAMKDAGLREEKFDSLLKGIADKGQIQISPDSTFTLAGNSLKDFEITEEKFNSIKGQNQEQTLSTEQKPVITKQMIQDLKLIDGNPEIFENPRTDGQQFKGKILHVDESQGYCVQQIGKNSLYVHKLEKLERTPEVGENLKISFDDKGEKAKISVQKERQHGLKR